MIQGGMLNGIDNQMVSDLIGNLKKKELILKFSQQYQSKQIICSKLLKIIKASATLEKFEKIAGKAMMVFRKILTIIKNENFSKIKLQDSSLNGMCFIDCNFSGSQMKNVQLMASRFIGCCFDNTNWKKMISVVQTSFSGSMCEICDLAISPDEIIFATCSSEETVQLWDLRTYEKLKKLKMQENVHKISFISNKLLIARIYNQMQIWNINSKKILLQHKSNGSYSEVFHGLMMGKLNPKFNQTIYLFSIQKWKYFRKYTPSDNPSSNFKTIYSPTSLLVVQTYDFKIIIWDFQKGRQHFDIISNSQIAQPFGVSPEKDFLALIIEGDYWGTTSIWDIKNRIWHQQVPGEILKFSKNGTIIAYQNFDKIHLFDILAKQITTVLLLPYTSMPKLSFLLYPKANFVLTFQNDKIMLFDTSIQQKQGKQIISHQEIILINRLFFSLDGKQILVFFKNKKIQIIDLDRRENLLKTHIDHAIQMSCSSDFQTIAYQKEDQNIVYLYDLKQQKIYNELKNNTKVNCFAISPNDQTLACGNEDFSIQLFKLQTLELIHTYQGHSKAVKHIQFSQDGSKLASGGLDLTIKLWSLLNFQLIATFPSSYDKFLVAFSPDSNILAYEYQHHFIKIWEVSSQAQISQLELSEIANKIFFLNDCLVFVQFASSYKIMEFKTKVVVLKFSTTFLDLIEYSSKSRILAGISQHNLQLYIIYQKTKLTKLITHESSVVLVKICKHNKTLVTFLKDCSLNIWDYEKILHRKKIQENQSIINTFSLSRSGNILAYSCKDSTIHLWDIESLQLMNTFKFQQRQINQIDFSDNEQYLVAGCLNGSIFLWDIKGQKKNNIVLCDNLSSTNQVLFSNEKIISIHQDSTIYFWNFKEQCYKLGFYKHQIEISSVALSFDQQTLAFGSTDGKVYLLNVENREVTQEFAFHDNKVSFVGFSSDGRYLASGSDDESVCLIKIKDGSLVDRFFCNENKVSTLVFVNDQEAFIQGTINGNIDIIYFDQKHISLIKLNGHGVQFTKGIFSTFSNAKITSTNGFDLVKVIENDQ